MNIEIRFVHAVQNDAIETKVKELKPIKGLAYLNELILVKTEVKDLSSLKNMKGLKLLQIL